MVLLYLCAFVQLLDQDIPKGSHFVLQFKIMLYPEDVENELIQDITRHFFFLEVNEKILSQEIYCPPETAMMMAAYAAQALYGEYDADVHKPGFLAIEDFIPQRVSDLQTYVRMYIIVVSCLGVLQQI